MITLTDASGWQPALPSPQLSRSPAFGGDGWRAYLRAQRYSAEEIAELVDGVHGDERHPGLAAHVSAGLRARAPEDRGPSAVAGLVVDYLEVRIPLAVHDLNPAPDRFLSSADFGARLDPTGERHDLGGEIVVDVLTGARWWELRAPRLQLGFVVTAGALYRALGLAAPAWRLVERDGARAAVCPELGAWIRLLAVPEEIDAIRRSRAADVWMLFGGRARFRQRRHAIEGLPVVCRYDLSSAFGYTGRARRDMDWGPRVAGADDLGTADVPMLERIAAVDDTTLRRAVALGDLVDDDAAELLGTLTARRERLRARLQRLTGVVSAR